MIQKFQLNILLIQSVLVNCSCRCESLVDLRDQLWYAFQAELVLYVVVEILWLRLLRKLGKLGLHSFFLAIKHIFEVLFFLFALVEGAYVQPICNRKSGRFHKVVTLVTSINLLTSRTDEFFGALL